MLLLSWLLTNMAQLSCIGKCLSSSNSTDFEQQGCWPLLAAMAV